MSAFPLDRSSFIPLSAEFCAHNTRDGARGEAAVSEIAGLSLRLSDSDAARRLLSEGERSFRRDCFKMGRAGADWEGWEITL